MTACSTVRLETGGHKGAEMCGVVEYGENGAVIRCDQCLTSWTMLTDFCRAASVRSPQLARLN